MFAVIKTGGKQYKVAAENKITVMSLPGEAGERIVFEEVLALFDGETNHVGAPRVQGASVVGEIVEQTRGPKVVAFKKRRRKNSKRKRGHRQDLTVVRVTEILPGAAPKAAALGAKRPERDSLACSGCAIVKPIPPRLESRRIKFLEQGPWPTRKQAVRRAMAATRPAAAWA